MSANGWREVRTLRNVPFIGGVYAIYLGVDLIYIGSSANLRKRLGNHELHIKRDDKRAISGAAKHMLFDGLKIKIRPARYYGEWAARELALIHRLRPRENEKHNSRRLARYAKWRPV